MTMTAHPPLLPTFPSRRRAQPPTSSRRQRIINKIALAIVLTICGLIGSVHLLAQFAPPLPQTSAEAAAAAPKIHIGGPAWITSDALACRDLAIFDRLADLQASGDDAAAARFVDQQGRAGNWIVILAGTKVFIEEWGGWWHESFLCARPEGKTACMFAPKSRMSATQCDARHIDGGKPSPWSCR
jgi:hypothetical protein